MNSNNFKLHEPEKYWTSTNKNIAKDICDNPSKYSDYVYSEKRDGYWTRIIVSDEPAAQSRTISKTTGTYGDKTGHIPHIFENLHSIFTDSVFLGELCFPDIKTTSKDVAKILQCKEPLALQRQKIDPLHFYIFDCLSLNGEDLTHLGYFDRMSKLKDYMEDKSLEFVSVADLKPVTELENDLAEIFAAGGEGVVLHKKDRPYAPGKRPAHASLKIKKALAEKEFLVTATIEPKKDYEGKEADTWAYVIDGELVTKPYYYGWKNGVTINNNGKSVDVASGLTDADREFLATADAQNLINEGNLIAVVGGMEFTEDGSIRHPYLKTLKIVKD